MKQRVGFLKKINKTDKPLARLTKKKKKRKTKIVGDYYAKKF
jgi:hypothetical protein